jgi:hypothetical protein
MRLDLRLVLLVVLDELFLLVAFGLEEEAAGLVKRESQTHQEFANAGEREALLESVAEEGLGHGSRLETPAGGFLNDPLLLGGGQVAKVSAISGVIESIDPFFSKTFTYLRRVEGSRSSRAATSSMDLPSRSHSKAR